MEEELKKSQRSSRRFSKRFTIFSGFAVLVVAVVVVTIIANNGGDHNKAPAVAVINVTSQGFQPATLSVKSGTKVVWTNDDTDLHEIASNPFPGDNGLTGLKSEILNNAQTYSYTANTVGSFGYHDQLNPTINGTLTVKK